MEMDPSWMPMRRSRRGSEASSTPNGHNLRPRKKQTPEYEMAIMLENLDELPVPIVDDQMGTPPNSPNLEISYSMCTEEVSKSPEPSPSLGRRLESEGLLENCSGKSYCKSSYETQNGNGLVGQQKQAVVTSRFCRWSNERSCLEDTVKECTRSVTNFQMQDTSSPSLRHNTECSETSEIVRRMPKHTDRERVPGAIIVSKMRRLNWRAKLRRKKRMAASRSDVHFKKSNKFEDHRIREESGSQEVVHASLEDVERAKQRQRRMNQRRKERKRLRRARSQTGKEGVGRKVMERHELYTSV